MSTIFSPTFSYISTHSLFLSHQSKLTDFALFLLRKKRKFIYFSGYFLQSCTLTEKERMTYTHMLSLLEDRHKKDKNLFLFVKNSPPYMRANKLNVEEKL